MPNTGQWEAIEHYWSIRMRGVEIVIEPRPAYCDRGHWYAKVFGMVDIDAADSFPRYFMDLERAKAEMREWLVWRFKRMGNGQP